MCFNPCFGGSYIVTGGDLMDIITYSKSFNPCFGGSYIVTFLFRYVEALIPKFQSLFWWILYCDHMGE